MKTRSTRRGHGSGWEGRDAAAARLDSDECFWPVELVLAALRPIIEARGVHDDLTGRVEFDVRTVHRARGGTLAGVNP